MVYNILTNMSDDLDYNMKLIKLIKKRKVLYDHTCDGNSNRLTQEQAWREIANELREDVTTCKDKWKNIRSCYTRHLRLKAANKIKKPYYLVKQLEFLHPFCKILSPYTFSKREPIATPQLETSNSQFKIIQKLETVDDDSIDIYENDAQAEHIYIQESNGLLLENETNENQDEETEEQVSNDYIDSKDQKCAKRKTIHPTEQNFVQQAQKKPCLYDPNDNPDLTFFRSLLPDLQRMSNKQKIQLKLRILTEINSILYPDVDSE